jgi:hypothetical protein
MQFAARDQANPVCGHARRALCHEPGQEPTLTAVDPSVQ